MVYVPSTSCNFVEAWYAAAMKMLMRTPERGCHCFDCAGPRTSKGSDTSRRIIKRSERQKWKKEIRDEY